MIEEGTAFAMHEAMRDIYERLKPLGFTPSYIRRNILPDWWEDRFAEVPADRAYAEAVLARQLGMELASLRDPQAELQRQLRGAFRLKSRTGATLGQMGASVILGSRLAAVVSSCVETPADLSRLTAASIRQTILGRGAKWVGFSELVEYCSTIGVPVVSLRRVPPRSKKPDGMAFCTEERPVIVMASRKRQPAWHLFILAHELGHVVKGHLAPGDGRVDQEVRMDATEREEVEASEFAVELLSGDPDVLPSPWRTLTAPQLAREAKLIGEARHIDPGFIALNYSRNKGFYAVGCAALNLLTPRAEARSVYRRYAQSLNLDALAEDNRHVFEQLTEAA